MFWKCLEIQRFACISGTRFRIVMGFGSKCRILNGQVDYIETSKLNIADMWLISLDRVIYDSGVRSIVQGAGVQEWCAAPAAQRFWFLHHPHPRNPTPTPWWQEIHAIEKKNRSPYFTQKYNLFLFLYFSSSGNLEQYSGAWSVVQGARVQECCAAPAAQQLWFRPETEAKTTQETRRDHDGSCVKLYAHCQRTELCVACAKILGC